MDAVQLLYIPELLDRVSSHLELKEIYTCVQVNHTWFDLFLPILWRTINVKGDFFNSEQGLSTFGKNGHLVRSLCIENSTLDTLFLPTCNRLTRLRIHNAMGDHLQSMPTILATLRRNPLITRLRITEMATTNMVAL
ncbi:hypothetical protein BGZ94_006637, partial [Podila epigama]